MSNTDIRAAHRVGDVTAGLESNEFNELFTAQGLPPYTEMARQGIGWSTMSTNATLAALVVRPTTLAGFEIFNPPANNVALMIDRLFFFNLVSTNVSESFSGWAQISTPNRVASAPTDGSFVVRGNTGSAYGGSVIAAESTTVIDSGWFPWAASTWKTLGGVLPQGVIIAEVAGRLLVPPGASLGLHVVASLVTQKFQMGASWYEKVLTIE